MALAGVTDVQALLGRVLTADEQTNTPNLLDQASGLVSNYCRQQFVQTTSTIVVWGNGTDLLPLPEQPVTAIGSVTTSPSGATIDPASYEIRDGGVGQIWSWTGERRFGWGAPGWTPRIPFTVVYTHGFNPIPPVVVGVVAGLVAAQVRLTSTNPGGVEQERIGEYSVRYNAKGLAVGGMAMQLGDGDMKALERYRHTPMSAELVRAVDLPSTRPIWS